MARRKYLTIAEMRKTGEGHRRAVRAITRPKRTQILGWSNGLPIHGGN